MIADEMHRQGMALKRQQFRRAHPELSEQEIDLMMRESSGLHLAREIRRRYPGVRTVLTSAYPLGQRQLERLDCGVVGFVPKPFDFGDVVDFLRAKASSPSLRSLPEPD